MLTIEFFYGFLAGCIFNALLVIILGRMAFKILLKLTQDAFSQRAASEISEILKDKNNDVTL